MTIQDLANVLDEMAREVPGAKQVWIVDAATKRYLKIDDYAIDQWGGALFLYCSVEDPVERKK